MSKYLIHIKIIVHIMNFYPLHFYRLYVKSVYEQHSKVANTLFIIMIYAIINFAYI